MGTETIAARKEHPGASQNFAVLFPLSTCTCGGSCDSLLKKYSL